MTSTTRKTPSLITIFLSLDVCPLERYCHVEGVNLFDTPSFNCQIAPFAKMMNSMSARKVFLVLASTMGALITIPVAHTQNPTASCTPVPSPLSNVTSSLTDGPNFKTAYSGRCPPHLPPWLDVLQRVSVPDRMHSGRRR